MNQWKPISEAVPSEGKEILGCKYQWDGRRMVMVREPFVTSWSEKAGKWIANPSHWTACPDAPEPTEQDRKRKPKPVTE